MKGTAMKKRMIPGLLPGVSMWGGTANAAQAAITFDLWEAFKIFDGKINTVEAFMKILPVEKRNGGWE